MARKPIGPGLYTAIITPFDEQETVDLGAFRAVLEYVLGGGVDGVVVAGTTGEAHSLSLDERMSLWDVAVTEVRGRVPVVAGCGATTTREAQKYMAVAADSGCDAALCLAPWFGKVTPAEIERYYLDLAAQSPLPIILYHNPSHTHVTWPIECVVEVAKKLGATAVGYKEAGADLARVTALNAAMPPEFVIFAGPPHRRAEFSQAGSHAAIDDVSNIIPAECVHAFHGDGPQIEFVGRVVSLLRASPNYIALSKATLRSLGLPAGKPRRPRDEAGADELDKMRAVLAAAGKRV